VTPAPTPTPAPPKLFVSLAPPSGKVYPGDTVQATVHVHASGATATEVLLRFSARPKVTLTPKCAVVSGACRLQKVTESGKFLRITVQIPKTAKPGTVTLTADATDTPDKATPVKAQRSFTVTKKATPSPTPTPTPTKGSGGSGGGTEGSGSGTGTGTDSGTQTGGLGPAPFPPIPSAAAQSPSVALPPVSPPPVTQPSVAPGPVAAPTSKLRAGSEPAPSELTFERLAGTQAAWLAALLAALAILLTQLRINRLAMGYRRPKGDHRRPRRGLFGR
jgi:hypothetical protein